MEIGYGRCYCGCGEKTNLAKQTIPKRGMVKGEPNRYIANHQFLGRDLSREKNPSWKGGRYVNDVGYVMVLDPSHPRAMANGYIREHILIAERALGKPLPEGVQVHHPGDVSDNGCIVICQDQNYHLLLHIRARALGDCGNANYRKCKFCQEYDDPDNLYVQQSVGHGWNVYHMECVRENDRRRPRRMKC